MVFACALNQIGSLAELPEMLGVLFDSVGYILDRWSIFLLVSTSMLPFMVWDIRTDQYRGFSSPTVIGYMLVMIPVGAWFAWIRDETRGEIYVTVVVGCLMMYLIPQLYAEYKCKRKHGVWLSQLPVSGAQSAGEDDENEDDDSG